MRWKTKLLTRLAQQRFDALRQSKRHASERSAWWSLCYSWDNLLPQFIQDFREGTYRVSPLQYFRFKDEPVLCWSYLDRIFVHLLYQTIKPILPHITSSRCFHLEGPTGVKKAIKTLRKAISKKNYRYMIRADIKGYYASIDHRLLLQQVHTHFQDPKLLNYLEAVITAPIDDGGELYTPTQGIPRRSSLSPALGALYLLPLD